MFHYQVPLTTDFPSEINNSKDEPFICPSASSPCSGCPPIVKLTELLQTNRRRRFLIKLLSTLPKLAKYSGYIPIFISYLIQTRTRFIDWIFWFFIPSKLLSVLCFIWVSSPVFISENCVSKIKSHGHSKIRKKFIITFSIIISKYLTGCAISSK